MLLVSTPFVLITEIIMIYTVTLNPSLDYVTRVKKIRVGEVNRSDGETILPGGKGINVSLMLMELGCETQATGFLAGFTGIEIRRLLSEKGLVESFLLLKNGFSRINMKIKSDVETEINGAGPSVSDEEREAFMLHLRDQLREGDTLVLSGSAPLSLPQSFYGDIARMATDQHVRIVADISGQTLWGLLPYRPFLVKPNQNELEELFGVSVKTRREAAFYARKLQAEGAENVLVSLAGEGAVLVTENAVYYAEAPSGTVVNSVGAGDSSVAGFIAGWLRARNAESALALAVAAGSATAFSEGIATKETVDSLLFRVKITCEA